MILLKAIKEGATNLYLYKRMILLLYVSVFMMSLCVAYPLKKLLETTVGHSLMVEELMKGFDYEFFNDFNNAYGVGWTPIFDQSLVVVFLFLILFVFFNGGIYAVLINKPTDKYKQLFWGGSAHYFWSILRLSLFFMFIHSLVFACFAGVFYWSINGELQNEGILSLALKIAVPFYYIVALVFFVLQDYTKLILVQQKQKKLWSSFVGAIQFVKTNFWKTYLLYLVNMLFWGLLMFVNYQITMMLNIDNFKAILSSFLLSQVFVVLRIYFKLLNISSIVQLEAELKS